jgi:hypothetical protein
MPGLHPPEEPMTRPAPKAPPRQAAAASQPTFLLAHIPSSDLDRNVLGAPALLDGHPFTHPTLTTLRRGAVIRKLTHLPSLLVAGICVMVVMDLSASGVDPFSTWPLPATLAVIAGWASVVTYLATFRTPRLKALSRCTVFPISTAVPDLPKIAAATDGGADMLTAAVCGRKVTNGDKLDFAEIEKRLNRLAATLR